MNDKIVQGRSYLDYNATAPLRPEARAAMLDALDRVGNPSSVHAEGRWGRRIVEAARAAVAELVGADPAEVAFTSGGTEANSLALLGAGRSRRIVSAIEHPSVLAHATDTVPGSICGTVEIDAFIRALQGAPEETLVSLMLANNETGVLQPVDRLVHAVRRAGAISHTDAIQACGKIRIDFKSLDIDLMTMSAHKLGGPMGIGALIVRDGVELAPQLVGGGQERRRRAGTENLPGIAGFGAAAQVALATQKQEALRLAALRDRLEAVVRRATPAATIYGAGSPRLPNTSCIGLPGASAETLVMALDLAGIAVSAGSACSSGKVARSHVLTAMGVPDEAATSAIRISLGWATADADIDRFATAWSAIAARCCAA